MSSPRDYSTESQRKQLEDILGASCFTEQDRSYWRLTALAAERAEMREIIQNLAAEYRRRTKRAA